MQKLSLRKKAYLILEGREESEETDLSLAKYLRLNKRFDTFMLGLIFLNIMAFVLETIKPLYLIYNFYFEAFEVFSIAIFTLEYVIRVWCIVEDKTYPQTWLGRYKYITSFTALIDLMAFLPFYLPLIYKDFRFIRAFRLFRLFRIFKLWRYSASLRLLLKIILNKKEDLQVIFFTLVLLLIVSSSLMYMIESEEQPENFASIPETMWWAVSALTTVGYGDIYPKTALGKILASFISVIGIGLFAIPAGIISASFMQEMEKNNSLQTALKNAEKIRRAFNTSVYKLGNHSTIQRAIDLITIKSRLQLSEQDIFDAIKQHPGLRIRFKRNIQTERYANTLVLESYEFNRAYGSYLNRVSKIAIISPMSYAEHSVGHFTAHLATYLEADYLSNEIFGEDHDYNSNFAFSFSTNEAYINQDLSNVPSAFLHFKEDLENVIQPSETVFIIKSCTSRTEDFNLHFGGKKGETGFEIENPTVSDTEHLRTFYRKLALNFHEQDMEYRFVMHRSFDNISPNTIHQYIRHSSGADVVTLYINNDLMEWTNDETYYQIIQVLGDTMKEFFG